MEHEMYLWQTMVFQKLIKCATQIVRLVCQSRQADGKSVGVHSRLIDYIKDALPEIETEEAARAVAFHKVTDQELPSCCFMTGDILVWNDALIAKDHPARLHCGDGPFRVVRDESYLVAFGRDSAHNKVRGEIEVGNDRLVLISLSTQQLIIAHGGLFTEM